MILVVDPADADSVCAEAGGYVIGELIRGERKVNLV